MKRKTGRRILAGMTAAVLIMSTTAVEAEWQGTQEREEKLQVQEEQVNYMVQNSPEAVSEELIRENKHIARLNGEETDESTLVFLNADHTATMYCYEKPVKYRDEQGRIKDKSNRLYDASGKKRYAKDYAYVNEDNDIRTCFPKKISREQGIVLNSGYGEVELSPDTETAFKVRKEDGKNKEADRVIYEDVFGAETYLKYEADFQGFKEEIVLENKNAGNEFAFIVRPGGLEPVCRDNRLCLLDEEGKTVIETTPLYVYDSYDGEDRYLHTTENSTMKISPLSETEYLLQITVDPEYLGREDTVYPVYVDPSFAVTATGSGTSKTVQDVPIYNGSGAKGIPSGSNAWNLIGYVGTVSGKNYGAGRVLMKFPGLLNSNTYKKLKAESIKKVLLYLYEGSGKSQKTTISAYQYTGAVWTETAATCSNSSWSGYAAPSGSASVGSASESLVSINITGIVKGWKNNSANAQRGLMLKNTNESSAAYRKDMRSTESTKKPYLAVSYVYYGCRPFNATNSDKINCHGYACFTGDIPIFLTAEDHKYIESTTCSEEKALARTKSCMNRWLEQNFKGRYKEVSGPGVTLSENQWLIVMRIRWVPVGSRVSYDYHFWYRTNTGVWANKHGLKPSVLLPPTDQPTTDSSSGWYYGDVVPRYYTSDLVYYVLTK